MDHLRRTVRFNDAIQQLGNGRAQLYAILVGAMSWAIESLELTSLLILIDMLKTQESDWGLQDGANETNLYIMWFFGLLIGSVMFEGDSGGLQIWFVLGTLMIFISGYLSIFSVTLAGFLAIRAFSAFGVGMSGTLMTLTVEHSPVQYRSTNLCISHLGWT